MLCDLDDFSEVESPGGPAIELDDFPGGDARAIARCACKRSRGAAKVKKKTPAQKGAKAWVGSGTSGSKFERHLAPGYGEGRSLKEAKSYVPRKTSAMEAGPGEFSFTRWRAERKA